MMLFAFFKEMCEDGKYKMYLKEDIACTEEKPPMLLFYIYMYVSELFDPLKTKDSPLYLKTQSVPRSKHFSSRL